MCAKRPAIVFAGGSPVQRKCYKGRPLPGATYAQTGVQYYVLFFSHTALFCFSTVMDALFTVEMVCNILGLNFIMCNVC